MGLSFQGDYNSGFDFFNHVFSLHAPAPFQEAYGESMGSSCQTFRDGTTSLDRDGVRLTSHSLLLELVGWVESPRQQLAPSMAYHMSVRSRTGWGFS